MAVSCNVGRPYHVADIPFGRDPDQELYNQFYNVCRSLSYYDTIVLARALKVDVRAVRYWQAHRYFPRRGTAMLIIDWVERGKPRKVITQAQSEASAF